MASCGRATRRSRSSDRQADGDHDAEQHVEARARRRWWRGPAPARCGGTRPNRRSSATSTSRARRTRRRPPRPADRERRQQRPRAQHRQHRAHDGDQPAELGAPPDGVADRRPAAAAADRDAREAARSRGSRRRGRAAPLGVDRLAVRGGERAAGEDVVGVGRRRRPRAPARSSPSGRRSRRRGGPGGRPAGMCRPRRPRAPGGRSTRPPRRAQHADQRDRRAREEVAERQQHGERAEAEAPSARAPRRGGRTPGATSSTNDDAFSGIAESLPSWDGHHERDAGEVADQHRAATAGRPGRPAAGPSRAGTEPDHERERRGQRDAVVAGAATSDPSAAAVISAVVDSGPTESCRDEPRKTYTVRPPTAAHRVASGGTPATSAYAITWGMRYAVTVMPASTSPRSHVRS